MGMTQEEAIRIWDAVCPPGQIYHPADGLVALGLLKLDEPLSTSGKLCKALGWAIGSMNHNHLNSALKDAGLKIVEA
jgi:hypothetical protein